MLTSVSSVPGVRGVALFDQANVCIAHALRPPYEPILLSEAADRLVEAQTGFEGAGLEAPDFVAVKYEQGCVIVVNENDMRSIVLCEEQTNLAMLRVALRVVSMKARKAQRSEPPMHGNPMQGDQWGAGGHGNFAGASQSLEAVNPAQYGAMMHDQSHGASHLPVPSGRQTIQGSQELPAMRGQDPGYRPEGSSRPRFRRAAGMSWGERSTSQTGSVGIKVMKHVLRSLSDQIGDAAQGILEQELIALKATPRSLTVSQFADLIHGAARRVEDPERRKRFLEKALGDRE